MLILFLIPFLDILLSKIFLFLNSVLSIAFNCQCNRWIYSGSQKSVVKFRCKCRDSDPDRGKLCLKEKKKRRVICHITVVLINENDPMLVRVTVPALTTLVGHYYVIYIKIIYYIKTSGNFFFSSCLFA